ncbi:unnamed protein product, partial [Rotaria sordida]
MVIMILITSDKRMLFWMKVQRKFIVCDERKTSSETAC